MNKAELLREFIKHLQNIPSMQTFVGRTTLLFGINHSALQRDANSIPTDLTLMIDGVSRLYGPSGLSIVIDNALSGLEGTELGKKIKEIGDQLKIVDQAQTTPQAPTSLRSGSQKQQSMWYETVPVPWTDPNARAYEKLLIQGYSTPDRLRIIASDIGLRSEAIDFQQPTSIIVREVINEASRSGLLKTLIDYFLTDQSMAGLVQQVKQTVPGFESATTKPETSSVKPSVSSSSSGTGQAQAGPHNSPTNNSNSTGIGWLHLTDFHQGMSNQNWLWPGVKDILFDDLEKLHNKCGPWDLVLFTGDLTQRGSKEEFEALNKTLSTLWQHFQKLGSSPYLVTVPGNHDLTRPKKNSIVDMFMKDSYRSDSDVFKEFWADEHSAFQDIVNTAFTTYNQWWATHPFPKLPQSNGRIPGDFSAVFTKDQLDLGIVGLNTAFLQLNDEPFEGKLFLHAKQFHAACGGDGPDWVRRHDLNLLLTHHPPQWLTESSQKEHLNREITTPGRFFGHLFGHMHEHSFTEFSSGAAKSRRLLQGCSLFGLEYIETTKKLERSHGYSAARINRTGEQTGSFRLWPRAAKVNKSAGHWRIIPDTDSFDLEDDHGTLALSVSLNRKIK